MKALKIIGVVVGGLVGLWVIASAVLSSHAHVERTDYIHAPVEVIFENVNTLKNWEQWSFWMHVDTTVKITYNEIPSGKGASYSWDGKKIGKGKITIVESTPPSSLKMELEFFGKPGGNAEWKFEPSDTGAVKVTESFDKDLKFTEKVFQGLMMNRMLGGAYQEDLAKLKEVCKNVPATAPKPEIAQLDVPAQWVIAIRDTAKMEGISNSFQTSFGKLEKYLEQKKVAIAGYPLGVWHKADYTADVYDFEAALPIQDSIATGKGMHVFKVGGIKAVKTTHMGNYDKMGDTYAAIETYLQQNNLTRKGDSWEVYITDPMSEKDTTKWQTEIYYPL